jgi:hypothetical protein
MFCRIGIYRQKDVSLQTRGYLRCTEEVGEMQIMNDNSELER